MAKSPPEPRREGYLEWSREPAVGLFAVLPLWLLYEALRLTLAPEERNGVEVLVSEVLRLLGDTGFLVLRVFFGLTVLAAAFAIRRREIPWLRVALVIALEGTVYALVLGPLADALAATSDRLLAIAPARDGLVRDLVGSLGAGIFEELVFRLAMLSVLALAGVCAAAAFGLPQALGVGFAIVASSLLFSLFHHVGPGAAPIEARVFLFRTMAGLLLGVMFVVRGFGVCVYAHAVYDLHFYLTHD